MAGDAGRERLKAFMSERGLKPKPWCDASGVSKNTIYNFLNGTNSTITVDTLEKLAKGAGVTVPVLSGSEIEQPQEPISPEHLTIAITEADHLIERTGATPSEEDRGKFILDLCRWLQNNKP
tara:strand:- start:59 stop:424 length:366 start_codon:yes stop_codon:yes gene_type:complete